MVDEHRESLSKCYGVGCLLNMVISKDFSNAILDFSGTL